MEINIIGTEHGYLKKITHIGKKNFVVKYIHNINSFHENGYFIFLIC